MQWALEQEAREEEREAQAAMLKMKLDHEKEMASIGKSPHSGSHFDPSRYIRLVPRFQEKDVDKYFIHFEKVAKSLDWPEESWVLLLQS